MLAITAGADALEPFAGYTLMEVMTDLTAFNGCVALTALLLGAVVAEHRNIRPQTEHAVVELEALVEQLAPLPGPSSARYDDGPPHSAQ